MKILENIESALSKDLPFVIYKTPNSDFLQAFFQEDVVVHYSQDYSESGFIFAPFNSENKAVLFPKKNSVIQQERIAFDVNFQETQKVLENKGQKEFHVGLVSTAVDAIKDNQFLKLVMSRAEEVLLEDDFSEIATFKKLVQKYPTAFVYFWFHPKIGKWMGATPETLVATKNKDYRTMSLAGTQVYQENISPSWSSKEVEEQYIVTDFIKSKLESISEELSISELETIRIGGLLHLRTMVKGEMKNTVSDIINVLHPTPAVCGLPKESAKQFILEKEGYNREFYTGFLGELNLNTNTETIESNLFVNLRCMQLYANFTAKIYVGGGITKDSVPEKEWLETVQKSGAMKSVL